MRRPAGNCGVLFLSLLSLASAGCSDETAGPSSSTGGGAESGVELTVPVPAYPGRAFVDITVPSVVEVSGDGSASTAWDIAFEGLEVYTNSGVSGPGLGGALGPYGPDIYVSGKDPASPIITRDSIGGAFLRWYAYDYTKPAHALFSRYHVFGLREGGRTWKVQILSYYGEVNGAPVSAMYSLRYAELFPGSAGPTTELSNIDGTAGGAAGTEDSPSGCLDLGTGKQALLAPKEAAASSEWHLCFRREVIDVNGELGGPRGASAVDIDLATAPFETVDSVSGKTAESELAHFNEVTLDTLNDPSLVYRGDRKVSIFADQWLLPGGSAPSPLPATWVVVHAADGDKRALITFPRFEGAAAGALGSVIIDVKQVLQ